MASGLAAKLEGRVLMVGANIFSKSFGSRLSKVYRLNQVDPGSAADYLANLGASVTKTNTITTAVSQGTSESSAISGAPSASTTQTSTEMIVEAYGASTGPLLGLQATTDARLGTITLIGDPSIVLVAEQYLRQLDLRQRQVAVNVKILSIDLQNDLGISNSFSAKLGNTFIVSDKGAVSVNFGNTAPATSTTSEPVSVGVGYSQGQLLDAVNMAITNSSGKSLANPTLLVMEGQEATVKATTSVITDISTTDNSNNTTTSTTTRSDAGLTLKIKSGKIDDNGFVTLSLKPEVSIPTPAGTVNVGGVNTQIFNITQRSLESGSIRLRDGQTLVLTGVIQDSQIVAATKTPILGDLPFIGQFFRGSTNTRTKNELVIIVTPRIIDDEDGGRFGYGYRPVSNDARQMMGGAF
jgi:type IV pilus assembly protein PilQ